MSSWCTNLSGESPTHPARVRIILPVPGGRYLFELIDRPEHPENLGKIRLPGGGVKPDESLLQAAVRELEEEFGIPPGRSRRGLEPCWWRDDAPQFANEFVFLFYESELSAGTYVDADDGKTITLVEATCDDPRYVGPPLADFVY